MPGRTSGSGSPESRLGAIEKELKYLATMLNNYPDSSKTPARKARVAKLQKERNEVKGNKE